MKLQGHVIDKTPGLAHAAGGAGSFAQGFVGALGAFQDLEAKNQAMEGELEDRRRHESYLNLATKEHDLAVERFLEQQRENKRKGAREDAKRKAFAALNSSLFGSVMKDPSLRTGGYGDVPGFQKPKASMSPASGSMMPPEWDAEDERLRAAAESGEITPQAFAGAMRMKAIERGAALRPRAAADFAKTIERDTMPGPDGVPFWSSAGALGVQVDYDEKTGPDPLEQVPAMALQRLKGGNGKEAEDPLVVAQWYQAVKDQAERGKNQRIAVQGVAQEIQAELGTRGQRLNARQRAEITTELSRFARGDGEEYAQFDEMGEKVVRQRIAQIEAGTVPVQVGGKIVYASPEDAAELQAQDQSGKDPESDMMLKRMSTLARFVGPFRHQPTVRQQQGDKSIEVPNPISEEEQFQAYLERGKAVVDAFGFGQPRMSNVQTGARAVDPSAGTQAAPVGAEQPDTMASEDPAQAQKAMLPGTATGPRAAAQAPATTKKWSDLAPDMQSKVGDALEQAADAVRSGRDPQAMRARLAHLKQFGVDVESLPPELVAKIKGKKLGNEERARIEAEIDAELEQESRNSTGRSVLDTGPIKGTETKSLIQPGSTARTFADYTDDDLLEIVKRGGWTAQPDIQRELKRLKERRDRERAKK